MKRLKGKIAWIVFVQFLCVYSVFGQLPSVPAPVPVCPSSDVISLYSNSYVDVPVNTFLTPWSPAPAAVNDLVVSGNNYKSYSGVSFIGIETVGPNLIDASGMSAFHFDMWTPNMSVFRVKLVDFGGNGVFGGGDDREHEVNIYNPTQNTWKSFDLFLFDFPTLTSFANIAQIIFSGNPYGSSQFSVDNIYFSNCPNQLLPTIAAPNPTLPASSVISLYSDVYTDVSVDNFLASWSAAPVVVNDISIASNPTKCYQSATFLGIESTGANIIDASTMSHFHVDIWTPNMHSFRVKLVDFGANGVFGGGDDSEHEITYDCFTQENWVGIDIPLSDFTSLSSTSNIAQVVLSGAPELSSRFYMDNLYFYSDVPLPVELIDFSASLQDDNSVLLEWSTATEVNSDFFQLQQSTDGVYFENLIKVNSFGNSTSLIQYEHIDNQPERGDNFYRLKQVDFDGAFEYLGIKHVFVPGESGHIFIYPNPVQQSFTLHAELYYDTEISITTMLGSKILSKELVPSEGPDYFIDLPNIPRGAYLIRLENNKGIEVFKLVVE